MSAFFFRYRGGSLRGLRCRSFATQTQIQTRPSSALPWLMLSSPTNPEYRYFFDIVGGRTLKLNRKIHLPQISLNVCIGASHGLLFSIPTCDSPEKIHAINPLHPEETLPLPPNSTLQGGDDDGASDSDSDIDAEYQGPIKLHQSWKIPGEIVTLDRNYAKLYKSKAILSPSKDLLVLARFSRFLDFARLDDGVSAWTPVTNTANDLFDLSSLHDLIFHKGLLYVTDTTGNLLTFDFDDLAGGPVLWAAPDEDWYSGRRRYMRKSLVESPDGEDLFFLNRTHARSGSNYRTDRFEVFRLGSYREWEKVESIGDLVMFVGHGRNFSLYARDFPNLRANSIYFTDYYFDKYIYLMDPLLVGDTGVFSLKDGSIQFFKLFDGTQRFNWPPPIWYCPAADNEIDGPLP